MFARMLSLLASLFSLHDNGVSLCPNALYPVSKAGRVVGISQSRETRLQGNEDMEGGSQTNCCLLPPFGVPLGQGQGQAADPGSLCPLVA